MMRTQVVILAVTYDDGDAGDGSPTRVPPAKWDWRILADEEKVAVLSHGPLLELAP